MLLAIVMLALIVSGATAIPLRSEVDYAVRLAQDIGPQDVLNTEFGRWLRRVQDGVTETRERFPFMSLGTDWLAFAHFVLALLFVGPWRDPVRNLWVIHFGIITCVLVIPYAFLMGTLRGTPVWWQMIDASFGVLGVIPLWLARRWVMRLSQERFSATLGW